MRSAAFYHRFFTDNYNAHGVYHQVVEKHLPESGIILDLGCGDNADLSVFRLPSRQVWGTDFQEHPELHNQEYFRLLPEDGRIPFPDGTFDLVGARWVLEHVEHPIAFFEEVKRVLRPGGMFVGLTINRWHYVSVIAQLLHLFPHSLTQWLIQKLYGRAEHDTFPTHYRSNSKSQLKKVAQAVGLELTSLDRIANPAYFSFSDILVRMAIVTDWTLEKLIPGMGRIYFVSALRKPGVAQENLALLRKSA